MSSLNHSVVVHLDEAQDFLTDGLQIAEDMRNLTAVRPDILLLLFFITKLNMQPLVQRL